MMRAGRVRIFLYFIVVMNLAALLQVFVVPRLQSMHGHWGWTLDRLQETQGPRDLPNQYFRTYRIANRIDRLIPEAAAVFLPPVEHAGSFRSAAVQVLFPRPVFSADMEDFEINFNNAGAFPEAYFVSAPDWYPDFCPKEEKVLLNDAGWGMCRIGENRPAPDSEVMN